MNLLFWAIYQVSNFLSDLGSGYHSAPRVIFNDDHGKWCELDSSATVDGGKID